MNINQNIEIAKRFEKFKPIPYYCSGGKLTIFYGHNIYDDPSPQQTWNLIKSYVYKENYKIDDIKEVAEIILKYDLKNSLDELVYYFNEIYWERFPEVIRIIFLDMNFNMGFYKFTGFKNMITAAKCGEWNNVVKEMKDSKWYNQVGERSKYLIKLLKDYIGDK